MTVIIDFCQVGRSAGPTADLQRVLVQNSPPAMIFDDLRFGSSWSCVEGQLKDNDASTSFSRKAGETNKPEVSAEGSPLTCCS
jgi:hypothetical protein